MNLSGQVATDQQLYGLCGVMLTVDCRKYHSLVIERQSLRMSMLMSLPCGRSPWQSAAHFGSVARSVVGMFRVAAFAASAVRARQT